MNEIEKLYENCEIKKKRMCEWTCRGNEFCSTNCEHYESTKEFYPPFTAEKQLELIKWLMRYDEIHGDYNDDEYGFSTLNYSGKYKKDFEESLASVINNELWQDLTEEEKEQIRGILNG
jgi:hypothetical protein